MLADTRYLGQFLNRFVFTLSARLVSCSAVTLSTLQTSLLHMPRDNLLLPDLQSPPYSSHF